MRAIRVTEQSADTDNLRFEIAEVPTPVPTPDQCLVEIAASGVNPSDVRAFTGRFPHLVWPRIPGRDYAGTVVEGPSDLIGKRVWGTGGDLGMSRDGSHAGFCVIDRAGISEMPERLTMREAGAIGCAWTCAWLGMVDGSNVQAGETAVILGANSKVGEAAIQIATAAGASVIGVERSRDSYGGHASGPIEVVNLQMEPDLRQLVLDRTRGRGADIILNIAGSPYFEAASRSLAKQGRQIIITTKSDECVINLRAFYRGNQRLVGVSNMDWDHVASARLMEAMRGGFEAGRYEPYPIRENAVHGLDTAGDAYTRVIENRTRDRQVIVPAPGDTH